MNRNQSGEQTVAFLRSVMEMVEQKSGCWGFALDPEEEILLFRQKNERSLLYLEVWQMGKSLEARLCWGDEETSFSEDDYDTREEFAEDVAKIIALLLNHAVKVTRECVKRECLRIICSRQLENGEWETLSDDLITCRFLTHFVRQDRVEERLYEF